MSEVSAEIKCAAKRSSYWTGEVMMKLQIEAGRVQHLKYTGHKKSTSSGQRKYCLLYHMVCSDVLVYKATFHLQWILRALCKNDPNLKTIIQLRHVVN